MEVGEFGLDLLWELLEYENRRVEEAVARNSALKEELEEKKDETIELQRRLGSVGKVLRKSAKDVETGRYKETPKGWRIIKTMRKFRRANYLTFTIIRKNR